jgi:ATP-dependent DNA ligase
MKSRTTQRTMFQAKALTVQTVYKTLLAIAKLSGSNSGNQKKDKIKALLVASKGVEAQYVVRHLREYLVITFALLFFTCSAVQTDNPYVFSQFL